MKYLRVKPEFGQFTTNEIILISHELYTVNEYNRLKPETREQIPLSFFDEIEIGKQNTYILFGCRFEKPRLTKELENLGYSLSREFSGSPKRYVLRFRDYFIVQCTDSKEGIEIAKKHNKERQL